MNKTEKVKEILKAMEEVEEDIKILQSNINNAKEYLENNDAESIDADYFDECLDIEQGLKHIELFWLKGVKLWQTEQLN